MVPRARCGLRCSLLGIIGVLIVVLGALQSCTSNSSLKSVFTPPPVAVDTNGPFYLHNVSQVKYWDRVSSAQRATNFAWWDSSGTVREMNDFYDKVIVLSFFGTWSSPALAQLPVISSIRSSGDTNVLFLGVTMREGVTGKRAVIRIDSIAHSIGIPYQVLIGSRDFGFTYGGVDVVPTTFVITRRRKVEASFEGFVPEDKLKEAIGKAEGKP